MVKRCNSCKQDKNFQAFNKQENGKFGLKGACRACLKEKAFSNWQKKTQNLEKQFCNDCQNIRNICEFKYNNLKRCKPCLNRLERIRKREEYHKDIEKARKLCRTNSKKYKSQRRKYQIKYWHKNKSKLSARKTEYITRRRKIDPIFRLKGNLRVRLSRALKGENKSESTFHLIGCSVDELKFHLESKFVKGMSWNNYGEWHVDHIKPCVSFDFSKEEEQKICFHYTNLQPLWKEDNLKKGGSYV